MIAPRPDGKGLHHFFTSVSAGATRTCFEGITALAPGHFMKSRDGRTEIRQYWDLDFPDAGEERRFTNPSAGADELEHLLRRAVGRRLRGDVPVVSYISGGL